MRKFRFIVNKQALVVFLVFIMAAGAFLGTPARVLEKNGGQGYPKKA